MPRRIVAGQAVRRLPDAGRGERGQGIAEQAQRVGAGAHVRRDPHHAAADRHGEPVVGQRRGQRPDILRLGRQRDDPGPVLRLARSQDGDLVAIRGRSSASPSTTS